MPVEFWREVVDRVAQEVPDTLLLAEAFWLMEGYFVRTLGMHRVYNSAFMNMLRDEKNAEYRLVIKNTLEFDPEILKRYVNFMNNPDERTAVDQFGKDDKYFGVCTMMVTLPGLPMFGHGQIEGFTEKYGMEYRSAYWDEKPDEYLIERHQREDLPLAQETLPVRGGPRLSCCMIFTPPKDMSTKMYSPTPTAQVMNAPWSFTIINLPPPQVGSAYQPPIRSRPTAVSTRWSKNAWVKVLVWLMMKIPTVSSVTQSITWNTSVIKELHEKGLYIELEAYKCQVFTSFRQVQDNEWHQYANLAGYLNGRGVPNIDEAMKEIFLQPIHQAFRELVNAGFFRWVISNRQLTPGRLERSPTH